MIEKGDKVKVIKNISHFAYVEIGEIYEVVYIRKHGVDIVANDNGKVYNLYLYFNEIELIEKPFTQQDLEIGMLCKTVNNHWWTVNDEDERDGNINNDRVVAIYKKNDNGDLIKVWEREEEKLYTLELPNNKTSNRFYCHHTKENSYSFKRLNKKVNRIQDGIKYFTQKEIDNLPNKELIKSLIKNEVK